MSLFQCSREQELGDTGTVVSVDSSMPDGTATDRSFSGTLHSDKNIYWTRILFSRCFFEAPKIIGLHLYS